MNEWNDIAVIAPTTDIDLASVPRLREQVDALIDSGVRRVLVNCQNVTFIDSTGLAFLLSRARALYGREGLLSLVNASSDVARFLQIARLIDILHVSTVERPAIPVIAARALYGREGLLSLVNASSDVARFLQIARLIDILHVSTVERPAIPVIAPDVPPLWSKSFTIQRGVEHLADSPNTAIAWRSFWARFRSRARSASMWLSRRGRRCPTRTTTPAAARAVP